MAKIVLGDDLDDAQFAWCVERLVPEAPGLTQDRVDLSPFRERTDLPRTWIRTMHDIIVPPEKQQRFAGNVGDCTMIDLEFGHMCMVGRPGADGRDPQPDRRLTDSCAPRHSGRKSGITVSAPHARCSRCSVSEVAGGPGCGMLVHVTPSSSRCRWRR